MEVSSELYKNKPTDKVWWVYNMDVIGEFVFTFDKKQFFNLFRDYPWKLTQEQKRIFDKENPFWAEFFKDRKEGDPKNGNQKTEDGTAGDI